MSETLSALLLSLTALLSSLGGGLGALNATPAQSQVAQVASSGNGVQFTLNTKGIQTLTYNGQSFLVGVAGNGPTLVNAYFKRPDGSQKSYGWTVDTSGNGDFYFSNASTTVGADFFQHVYHPGMTDSVTVKMKFTSTDSRTVKVTIDVTNNDPVNTLTGFNLNYFFPLVLPAAANQYQNNIPIVLGVYGQNAKPAQLWSGSWGSVAMWPDNYNTNTWFNMWYQTATQTAFTPIISNAITESVPPGQTWHYSFNVRFSATEDSITTLAPEAFSAVQSSFPYLLNWPDRRPIARAFISEGTKRSTLNPRGYLNDPLLDVSNATLFRQKMLEAADRTLANMNSMDPKPQGLMIWDLEGQEFNHAFTYVGYPSKLPDMAPEMDRIADEYFKKFTDAGYKVGMTLRPQKFGTGTALPSTCEYRTGGSTRDVFVDTDGPYGARNYVCTAPNTWQVTAYSPGHQVDVNDDAEILNILRSKISYARNRWGATIFYVDSTVYTGGTPINFEIWRTLQREFPDTLFFPENEATMYFGSSAPFNQANMGVFETFSGPKNIYPQAFSVIQATDGINYTDPATYDRALAAIKAGNIYMVDGWYSSAQNNQILKIYRDAGLITTPPTPTTPSIPSFSASPTSITSGQSSTLSWTTSGATSISITPGNLSTTLSGSVVVTPGLTTTYTLTATNTAGSVTSQSTVTVSSVVTPDTQPPTTPMSLTSSSITTTGATLSWSPSSDNVGVSGYKVFRNGTQVNTVTTPSYTDSTLSASTVYSYTVSAYDVAGNQSLQSTPVSVTTLSTPVPPPSSSLTIGSRVKTTSKLKVRATPTTTGKAFCTQNKNALGTITSGPTTANGYVWWQINYDTLCDGWSVQDYLLKQ